MSLAAVHAPLALAGPAGASVQRSRHHKCFQSTAAASRQAPAAPARRCRRRTPLPPSAVLDFFFRKSEAAGGDKQQRALAVQRLLGAIEGSGRGLDQSRRNEVLEAVEELKALGEGSTTTDARTLSATWRLLWTTERETLFILEKAGLFGTQAGEVYQVIDVEAGTLQNVITFPPEGAFIVDSGIAAEGPQRTAFQFSAATLRLPKGRRLALPPFGKGWFDTVYCDDSIRVAQDSRGDTLVVQRDGPPHRFE